MASKKAKISQLHGDENRKELLRMIQKLGYRKGAWEVFNDFLCCTAISLANSADPHHLFTDAEVWNEREQLYKDTMKKYELRERQMFPMMAVALVNEMESWAFKEEYRDVLGEVFHELEFHNKWKGQFFTPQSICNMMGISSAGGMDVKRIIEEYGYISVNEPCCGGGAMIYGFLNAFHKQGFNHGKQLVVIANDVDERCVWMTFIQCSLYGVPAIVSQQNTLTMETYGAPWMTPVYIWEGWPWRRQHKQELMEAEA